MSSKKIPVINYSDIKGKNFFNEIISSRQSRNKEIVSRVENILENIKNEGDKALIEYTRKFDLVELSAKELKIPEKEISERANLVDSDLKKAINEAAKRIEQYHEKQVVNGFKMKTSEGVLGQRVIPLSRIGVYIPGGKTVYPSTVCMDIIPAKIAGVKSIAAVTPPRDNLDPGVAYALKLLNVSEVYRVGGAQAVGALAYGTKNIKSVEKIVGPGNAYVAAAKRAVYGIVDIDSIAGPSEVAIMADDSVKAEWVALDLLAQAEHGTGDEVAICVTENREFAEKIASAVVEEINRSPLIKTFDSLPEDAISVFVTDSREESIGLVNEFAPEHLQIMTREYTADVEKIVNASAIFLGPYTPVALGDYFIGTNHVLPTGGAAKFSSPLGVDSFVKRISVAEVSSKGLTNAAPYVSKFARCENFIHHALSVERRVGD
jgi:histidinol dehydrogenase